MNRSRRFLHLLACFLGFIGLIGCVAVAVGVWISGVGLTSTTENLFGEIDDAFVVAGKRVARTQRRVQASKITTESIEQSLTNWAKKEAGQRLTSQLDVKEKSDRLLEEIGSVRRQVAQTMELVDRIRERAADDNTNMAVDKRIDEAARLTLRLLATFSSIDAGLANIQNRVFETQEEARHWKTTAQRWILIATICVSLLMAWMAVGQFSLCWHGWKACR